MDVIVQWYDNYIEEHFTDVERSLMPNHYNARKLPSLLSLAQADDAQGAVPREGFVALTQQMLADVETYKTCAKRDLADVLCKHSACTDLKDIPVDDVLQRYCAYFRCRWRCNVTTTACRYMTYEQMHAHWREAHPDDPWLMHEDLEYTVVDVAELWPHSVPVVGRRVLEAVGIALDTPREVLDEWVREGRLFCACKHPGMPLPEDMSWAKLVSAHVRFVVCGSLLAVCVRAMQLFHLLHQVRDHGEREREMYVSFRHSETTGPNPQRALQEAPRRQAQPELRARCEPLVHRRRRLLCQVPPRRRGHRRGVRAHHGRRYVPRADRGEARGAP